jgi:signal transduction histidine kinase/ActR/RegA family two-component response regulator/HAMP domain-containing protein/HPt (histidine-containing phosphotransfer) domain-containing protein
MNFRRLFQHRPLASKIALLVAMMGAVTIAVMAYALVSMRGVDRNYRALIDAESRLTHQLGEAALVVNDAARAVHTVLVDPNAVHRENAVQAVLDAQAAFNAALDKLPQALPAAPLGHKTPSAVPPAREPLASVGATLFEEALQVVKAAQLQQDSEARRLARDRFGPALRTLRDDLGTLRVQWAENSEASVHALEVATERTVWATTIAVTFALALVLALSISVAVSQISRPVVHLARIMQQLTAREYAEHIPGTHRLDEVGQMARALRVFQDSMQHEDRLTLELASSAQARRLSEQLVDLTSAIPSAVFQLSLRSDGQCSVLFVNDKAYELPGISALALHRLEGPLVGIYDAPLQARDQVHTAFSASFDSLEPVDFEIEVGIPDAPRWLRTLATARRTRDGSVWFSGVWQDVTDRRREAQALREARDVAERAAQDRAQFLAVMSHEIRTPLNAILGLAQLALKEPLSEVQHERVFQIRRGGKHLLGIVNDILDFSKIDGGHLQLEHHTFALDQLVADVVELFAPKAKDKGLSLHLDVSPDMPTRVVGDPQRVAQILINYVHNALKFTASGCISIRLHVTPQQGDRLLLRGEVHDTGTGLTESEVDRLFQPFHQADTSTTRRVGGTGLGLVISRQLAELMQGHAGVYSTPGRGSTFWFTAQVLRAPAQEPVSEPAVAPFPTLPPTVASAPPTPRTRQRVLVVDDNSVNLMVAQGLLEHAGVDVTTATDGLQALEALASASPGTFAAVLMDVQMPVMDGLRATRALRAQPQWKELPVIAMSANATSQDIEAAHAAGMDAYLTKPLLDEHLRHTLARWLNLNGYTGPTAPPANRAPPRPAPRADGPTAAAAGFDAGALEDLAKIFDPPSLHALIQNFIQNCDRRVALIEGAARDLDWAVVRRESHALGGSVGSFGLQRLSQVVRAIESTVTLQNGPALASHLIDLEAAASHGRHHLRAWQSTLAHALPAAGDAGKPV